MKREFCWPAVVSALLVEEVSALAFLSKVGTHSVVCGNFVPLESCVILKLFANHAKQDSAAASSAVEKVDNQVKMNSFPGGDVQQNLECAAESNT